MKRIEYLTVVGAAALLLLGACSQNTAQKTIDAATDTASDTMQGAVKMGQNAADSVDLNMTLKDAPSGVYTLEKTHAYINFSYLHQGYSHPILRWADWDSALNWDQDHPAKSNVDVTVQIGSVDSGVADFDKHLLSADFFDAAQYPQASFKSTSVIRTGLSGKLTGDLTIKNVTKPVIFDVTFNKAGIDRSGAHKLGFSARGHIQRSDFDTGKYVPNVGDDVDLIIEAEYVLVSK